MNLSTGELKFLSAAMALNLAAGGSPVPVAELRGIFRRPAELNAVRDQLIIGAFITHDPHRGEVRVLPDRVWQALNLYGITPELFPKDEFGAALSEVSVSNMTNMCQLSHAGRDQSLEHNEENFAPVPPKPKPTDPPPPIENPSKNRVRTDAAETEPMPPKPNPTTAISNGGQPQSSRGLTVSSVISEGEKKFKTGTTDEPNRNESGTAERHPSQINRQCNEAELMRDLESLLGRDEMNRSGGHWRVDHVRRHPTIIFNLLIQLRELIAVGWVFKTNRAAWLESSVKNELLRQKCPVGGSR